MDTKQVVGGLKHYFNNSATPIKILLEQGASDEVSKHVQHSRQTFIEGVRRLEDLAEDMQLKARIEDLRKTAETIDWTNLAQLNQFCETYKGVQDVYSRS